METCIFLIIRLTLNTSSIEYVYNDKLAYENFFFDLINIR